MAKPVTFVATGGIPVTAVSNGVPVSEVLIGGQPMTLTEANGQPVTVVDGPYAVGGIDPGIVMDFESSVYRIGYVPKTIDTIMSFSRAGSATYFDENGSIQSAGTDVPRLDYDPATGTFSGLLIEESRTNLAPNWGDSTAWTTSGLQSEATTTLSNGITGVQCTNSGSIERFAVYDVTNAAFITTATTYDAASSTTPQRQSHTFTTPLGCTSIRIYPMTNSGVSNYAYDVATVSASTQYTFSFWHENTGTLRKSGGLQVEAGSFPTSDIQTTGSSAARAADVCSRTLGSEWVNGAGTLVAVFRSQAADQLAVPAYFNTTTFNESFGLLKSNAAGDAAGSYLNGVMVDGGSTVLNLTASANTGAFFSVAVGFDGSALSGSVDGGAVSSAASALQPSPTKLNVGQRDGDSLWLNGHIKSIIYYPEKLTDAQLQEVTA